MFSLLVIFIAIVSSAAAYGGVDGGGGALFMVSSKFPDGDERSLILLKAHDDRRHQQILASGVDLPIGGTGRPDNFGLYYAKIGIGTPSKDYYVHVDTGTDIMWVNGIDCTDCPKKGLHGLDLTLYDPDNSVTGKDISCDQDFCLALNSSSVSDCKNNSSCHFTEKYMDGTYVGGYFVKDVVQYDSVSGDLQTKPSNGSVIFGMSDWQYGAETPENALDGVLGFGKSNSSMLSQLAASGKVKRMFAHCLDINGGGIFAIGNVVQPKVNSTPLITNEVHYAVNVTRIAVGLDFLNISSNTSGGWDLKTAIIDSGTTLAYLPSVIYQPLLEKIVSGQYDLRLHLHDQYTCFKFSGSVDDGFPPVTFYFENSISLKVYPHDYLFPLEDMMCIGWQNNTDLPSDARDLIVLGDLVLSNKLVLYDLENQTIGWTEYNCASSIKMKDEITGTVHTVGSHSLPSASSRSTERALRFWLLIYLLLHFGLLIM